MSHSEEDAPGLTEGLCFSIQAGCFPFSQQADLYAV